MIWLSRDLNVLWRYEAGICYQQYISTQEVSYSCNNMRVTIKPAVYNIYCGQFVEPGGDQWTFLRLSPDILLSSVRKCDPFMFALKYELIGMKFPDFVTWLLLSLVFDLKITAAFQPLGMVKPTTLLPLIVTNLTA